MSHSGVHPRRGEVWLVDFDPTKGSEIKKKRPAIVVSSDGVGKLPVKLVVPITEWNDNFSDKAWHVRLDPSGQNGLTKPSSADCLQLRCVGILRFEKRLGKIGPDQVEEVVLGVGFVIEHP
ncbi:MAG: type II toxin-antitoxin system PemK/MazF family toxin [Planctomycetota bacterium]|nr:type II toxin-antitoxin system PemK/MazF family toxin [Planctomycetota bacterium]